MMDLRCVCIVLLMVLAVAISQPSYGSGGRRRCPRGGYRYGNYECGGFAGRQCPRVSGLRIECQYYPGSDYGPCCVVRSGGGQKPGQCPRPRRGTAGTCAELCSSDYDCPGSEKCCSNGCGHVCTTPVIPGRY